VVIGGFMQDIAFPVQLCTVPTDADVRVQRYIDLQPLTREVLCRARLISQPHTPVFDVACPLVWDDRLDPATQCSGVSHVKRYGCQQNREDEPTLTVRVYSNATIHCKTETLRR
jgi:hypothetical protein